jgi:hypothetical protein
MTEQPESGDREEAGGGTDVGEGEDQSVGTPPIEEEGESGQTQHDAPEDDPGTPEDAPERTE